MLYNKWGLKVLIDTNNKYQSWSKMTIIFEHDESKTLSGMYQIPPWENKRHKYAKKADRKLKSDPTLDRNKLMFLYLLLDFYEYQLSLDELAAISGHMWNDLGDVREGELAHLLYWTGELTYEVRQFKEDQKEFTGNGIAEALKNNRKFYDRNKHEIGKS